MVPLRFAVPAIFATAAAVGCFSYFSVILLARSKPMRGRYMRLPPAVLNSSSPNTGASTQIDQPPSEDELAAAAFGFVPTAGCKLVHIPMRTLVVLPLLGTSPGSASTCFDDGGLFESK